MPTLTFDTTTPVAPKGLGGLMRDPFAFTPRFPYRKSCEKSQNKPHQLRYTQASSPQCVREPERNRSAAALFITAVAAVDPPASHAVLFAAAYPYETVADKSPSGTAVRAYALRQLIERLFQFPVCVKIALHPAGYMVKHELCEEELI